jgi:hypothetical protein
MNTDRPHERAKPQLTFCHCLIRFEVAGLEMGMSWRNGTRRLLQFASRH